MSTDTRRQPVTVLGDPLKPSYELVLAHEHIFIDMMCWLDHEHQLYEELRDRHVSHDSLPLVRQHPFACPDNLMLDDSQLMVDELSQLSSTDVLLVDVTPDSAGRDVGRIAEVARRTGVDVITGCGQYIDASWSPGDKGLSAEELCQRILEQFEGPLPPAVIGEIGTSAPISVAEERSLQGAAMAQAELNVPLYVHLHPWAPQTERALDIVEQSGGSLERTVLCHLEVTATQSVDDAIQALDRGCYIAFDIWGDEDSYGEDTMPRDVERAATAFDLTQRGYGRRIVHSQDVCTKSQLTRFGGPGYVYTHTTGRSLLAAAGMSEDAIHDHLAGNALRLLHTSV